MQSYGLTRPRAVTAVHTHVIKHEGIAGLCGGVGITKRAAE